MAHELATKSDGTAAMAYVGEVPWHKLGKALPKGASIEEWTAAAGFDFEIKQTPVLYQVTGTIFPMPDKAVIYRSDTGAALGVASENYKIVQPSQVLDFFSKVADNVGLELETAGVLYGGKRYWAMARVGEPEALLHPEDRVKGYLLLSSSADGMSATTGKFGTVRVVCNNTLSEALKEKGSSAKQRHSMEFDPTKFGKELGLRLKDEFQATMALFRDMARTPMSAEDMVLATMSTFEPEIFTASATMLPEMVGKVLKKKHVKAVNRLALTHSIIGADLLGENNAAIWLNAVTEQMDHQGGAREYDRAAESSLFKKADKVKSAAYGVARAYVDQREWFDTTIKARNLIPGDELGGMALAD